MVIVIQSSPNINIVT